MRDKKISENNMSMKDQEDLQQIMEEAKAMLEDYKNVPINQNNLRMLESWYLNIQRLYIKNFWHYVRLLKLYEDEESFLP